MKTTVYLRGIQNIVVTNMRSAKLKNNIILWCWHSSCTLYYIL